VNQYLLQELPQLQGFGVALDLLSCESGFIIIAWLMGNSLAHDECHDSIYVVSKLKKKKYGEVKCVYFR